MFASLFSKCPSNIKQIDSPKAFISGVSETLTTRHTVTQEEKMDNFTENSTDVDEIIQNLNQRIFDHLLPVTILIGVEAVVGLVGNILILCVYSKFYKHCNFRYFVLFLAVYDLTSCLITLPGEMYLQSNWFNFKNDFICKVKSYFNVVTAWGSAFTLFLLACDRYRKVCKPLSSQMKPSRALRLCLIGVVLSFCVAIPDAVLWGKQSYIYEKENYSLNLSICEKADKYKDKIYPFVYIISIYIIPLGIMTIVVCTVNTLIARKMFFKMNFSQMNHRQTTSSRLTSRKTIFTIFGNLNNSFHDSYSKSACNSDLNDTHVNVTEKDVSISLSNISLERLSNKNRVTRDTKLATSSTNVDVYVQTNRPTSMETCLRRENSRSIYTSSVTSRLRRTRHTQGTRRTLTESFSDTELRRKRKTLIMLILTSVFVLTISIYIALISVVAEKRGKMDIMRQLENSNIVVFLFFLRFYFINCIINPILYGLLDSRFRTGLCRIFCCAFRSNV